MISFRYLNENKSLILNRGNIYSIILILLIFILDRFSKIEIINKFNDNTYILNDFLNIDLIWNTGIGFGLLSFDTSFIYNTITAVIALIILALFLTSLILKKIDKLIFSIILGGALGNIYDRVFYNAVPDFIDLHYSSFHWFTFNIVRNCFVTD